MKNEMPYLLIIFSFGILVILILEKIELRDKITKESGIVEEKLMINMNAFIHQNYLRMLFIFLFLFLI